MRVPQPLLLGILGMKLNPHSLRVGPARYGQVPDSEAMVSRRLRDVDGKSRANGGGANGDIGGVMYVHRCTYVYIYIFIERDMIR